MASRSRELARILNADAGPDCNAGVVSGESSLPKAQRQILNAEYLVPREPVMDDIELQEPDDDEVDGDDVVQQSRDQQNEDAGDNGDERRDMSGGDDHDFSSDLRETNGANGSVSETGKARQNNNALRRVRF
jgi:hypothetical protein